MSGVSGSATPLARFETVESPLAVSIKSAARMVELDPSTIRDAIDRLQLPAFRVGRVIRIFVVDLEEWLARTPAREGGAGTVLPPGALPGQTPRSAALNR